jgi:hypothetical protein
VVPVWSLSLVASVLLGAPPVVLEGAPECPSAESISRELERIVTAPEGTEPKDTARVVLEGSELRIALATNDGQLLGERSLPAEGSCDERARSVAVVLGAWIATAHPEYLGALPDAPVDALAASVEPPPPRSGSAAPPATRSLPAEPAGPPARPAPLRAGNAWHLEPALAVGAELSDAGFVPAVQAALRYAPETNGFGVSGFALLAAADEREVGSGRARSFRWPLGAGVLGRLAASGVAFEVDAGLMVGLLHVQGRGFASNGEATDAQGGAFGALRIGTSAGRFRPFAAAELLSWLGTATASARLPGDELDLPAIEGVFLAGIGFVP